MPLPLLAIGAGISAASSLYGMYKGNEQKKAGEKAMGNLVKPTYEIPKELYENLSDAEKMEVEGLPAEQKKQFVQNVSRAQQSALKNQADRKGGLMGLQSSLQAETDAYTNLSSMDAAAQKESELRKQQEIKNARGAIAQAKDTQFNAQNADYQQGLQGAQGMIGSGMQNVMGGIQGLGSTALSLGSTMYNPAGGDGGGSTGARAGGGSYGDYKNSGGGMSRREWRNF